VHAEEETGNPMESTMDGMPGKRASQKHHDLSLKRKENCTEDKFAVHVVIGEGYAINDVKVAMWLTKSHIIALCTMFLPLFNSGCSKRGTV
jgi:hypothetical protein